MKKIITIVALSLVLSSNLIAKENKEISKNIENNWVSKVEEDLKYNPEKFIKAEINELREFEILTAEDSDKEVEKYASKMIHLLKSKDKTLCKK
jgi:hypothetical protein